MARAVHPPQAARIARASMSDLMAVIAGPASTSLGAEVAELLRVEPLPYVCERFPDGEAQVDLRECVRGREVYLLQSTSPPVACGSSRATS